MSPMNCVDEDSEISDEEERVSVCASAVQKNEGWLNPKNGIEMSVTKSGIFLGQSSREPVTSLGDEETNTSDEDSLLGSYPVADRVENSLEVGFHENGRQNDDATWCAINQEAEELFHFTGCAFHGDTHKAKRGKRNTKITLHSHTIGEEKSHPVRGCDFSSNHEELESDGDSPQEYENCKDNRSTEHSVVELLDSFQQKKKQRQMPVEIIPLQVGYGEYSAVELLDIIQDKTALDGDHDKYSRHKRSHSLSEKKSASTLGNRTLNTEDPIELICSTASSDYEESEPNLKLAVTEATDKTMAERIQEVVGTSMINDQGIHYALPVPLGLGLFGKLQQVVHAEKEKDANFSRIQQSIENTHDVSSWLDVKILSRYLEGKLVVCRCCLADNREGIHDLDIRETVKENKDCERILIFNSRICDDVDLDAGNCVRVHWPWKKVRTAQHGDILLCTYSSQIKSDDC